MARSQKGASTIREIRLRAIYAKCVAYVFAPPRFRANLTGAFSLEDERLLFFPLFGFPLD